MSNDIMLLKLDRPFDLNECLNIACLPAIAPTAGEKCWISGWGTLSFGGGGTTVLQEASVDIYSNEDCKAAYLGLRDDMVCANGKNNGETTDACQGDSGGPLVCEKGGQWYVHGATSYGNGCARPEYPGVWSRAAYNQEWITQISGVRPPPGEPPAPAPTPSPPTPPTPPTPAPGICQQWCSLTDPAFACTNYFCQGCDFC